MSFTFFDKSSQLKTMSPSRRQLDSFNQFTSEPIEGPPAAEDAQLGHFHESKAEALDELTQLPS